MLKGFFGSVFCVFVADAGHEIRLIFDSCFAWNVQFRV